MLIKTSKFAAVKAFVLAMLSLLTISPLNSNNDTIEYFWYDH